MPKLVKFAVGAWVISFAAFFLWSIVFRDYLGVENVAILESLVALDSSALVECGWS